MPVLYLISDLLYVLLYRVVGYRKAVVRENLANAFPEKSISERQEIERKFYRHLPDLIVETIKMRSISKKEVIKRYAVRNPEVMQGFMQKGKPVVVVTAHYANWEMGIFAISTVVNDPVLIVYKPLSNKRFDDIFNRIRSRFGAIMVPMKQTLRFVVKYKDQPHVSVYASDQTPTYEESDYFIPFLNQPTLVYTGAARIAIRMDSPLVFCHLNRIRRGYYECLFATLTERPRDYTVHELTDLYNRYTEEIIKTKPELWLWSHRRWKRKPLDKHQVSRP